MKTMKGIPVLWICGLLSTVSNIVYGNNQSDDTSQNIYDKKCPLQLDSKLPGINCSVPSYFCGQITCSALFSHTIVKLTMDITRTLWWPHGRIDAYVRISVPKLRFYWWRKVAAWEKFKVRGFPLKVKGYEGADVFLQVIFIIENGTIHFKAYLHAKWTNLTAERTFNTTIFAGRTPDKPITTIVVDGTPPPDDPGRPSHKRRKVLTTFAKVLIAMAVCALVLFLIVFATFYYFKKKKLSAVQVNTSEPPSYEEATSTKAQVPVQSPAKNWK